jgi:hypothetical protein
MILHMCSHNITVLHCFCSTYEHNIIHFTICYKPAHTWTSLLLPRLLGRTFVIFPDLLLCGREAYPASITSGDSGDSSLPRGGSGGGAGRKVPSAIEEVVGILCVLCKGGFIVMESGTCAYSDGTAIGPVML